MRISSFFLFSVAQLLCFCMSFKEMFILILYGTPPSKKIPFETDIYKYRCSAEFRDQMEATDHLPNSLSA